MADLRTYAPRRKKWGLDISYREVSRLMMEACDDAEVMSYFTTEELNYVLNRLNAEHQFRQKEKENEVTSAK